MPTSRHPSCQNQSITSGDLSKTSLELSKEATMRHDPPSYTRASRIPSPAPPFFTTTRPDEMLSLDWAVGRGVHRRQSFTSLYNRWLRTFAPRTAGHGHIFHRLPSTNHYTIDAQCGSKDQRHRYVAEIDKDRGCTSVCPLNEAFKLVGVGKVDRQMPSIFQTPQEGKQGLNMSL